MVFGDDVVANVTRKRCEWRTGGGRTMPIARRSRRRRWWLLRRLRSDGAAVGGMSLLRVAHAGGVVFDIFIYVCWVGEFFCWGDIPMFLSVFLPQAVILGWLGSIGNVGCRN